MEMVEFTKELTRQSFEAMEEDVPATMESLPNCQCVCHPRIASEESLAPGKCKCKASTTAAALKKRSEAVKPAEVVSSETSETPAEASKENGLNKDEIEMLSDVLEPDQEDKPEDTNSMLNVSQDTDDSIVPEQQQAHLTTSSRSRTKIPIEKKECKCFIRRMELQAMEKSQLDPIEEETETSGDKMKVSSALDAELVEAYEDSVTYSRRCSAECHCSCHRDSLLSQSQKSVAQEEDDKSLEPKCAEACAIHCRKPEDEESPRASLKPLINQERKVSDEFQEDLASWNKRKTVEEEFLKPSILSTDGQFNKRASEGPSSKRSSGKDGIIKRLTDSFRKSK